MGILGIDIGGSGVKAAIVNTKTGELKSERLRLPTPLPATPKNIAKTVEKLIVAHNYNGPVGCSFPAVVIDGMAKTANNIDKSWIGTRVDKLFEKKTGCPFTVYNDADLAGMAEITLGAGKDLKGLVVMVTIGTGLGSGVFYNGTLIPNFEMGSIPWNDDQIIEVYSSNKARKVNDLSYEKWAPRFDFFLRKVTQVCTPNHIILGGGASKKFDLYKDQLTIDVPIHIARFKNNAGIIGAAMAVLYGNGSFRRR